ncbi:Shikimate kinase 1 [Buchnera aphidicola (Thelaxes suberi)]|uniref:shikimate kinase AroK n=1 Tax=Buchnera aphidicola TaxID=9 RepID=UPI003463FB82
MKKKNIFLIGPMGAGKSTIGRYLSNQLDMVFYDSDKEIEKKTGADINWVFDIEGELQFRKREEKVINELTKKNKIVLATGGGAILSPYNRKIISSRGIVVYLTVNIDNQIIRTQKDKNRPLLNTNYPVKCILQKLSKQRNFLYKEIAEIILSTDLLSPKHITHKIITMVNKLN